MSHIRDIFLLCDRLWGARLSAWLEPSNSVQKKLVRQIQICQNLLLNATAQSGGLSHNFANYRPANKSATYANGASGQASGGVAAAVPPCSTKLQPDTIAAATLTMNGVSHGVVVGATANGPRCMAPSEVESIPASSPLYQDPGVVHPNGICGPRQRSSDDLRLQVSIATT
ncbi:hypothetical protein HPB51_018483 [Rhipicephalus microplus]|uniref:Uncharacterized protein n=1 Tax=Rhipicephalus microplus TaxID=6941 RepID=A0A9J6DB34_RHIMP|nr:hypothetical protein HPB51_018483 [Rhipicephalus microplus]